jgi:hypothetical protein
MESFLFPKESYNGITRSKLIDFGNILKTTSPNSSSIYEIENFYTENITLENDLILSEDYQKKQIIIFSTILMVLSFIIILSLIIYILHRKRRYI